MSWVACSSVSSSCRKDNTKIVAFLKTLTGDQPSFVLPILPPSAEKTPQPSPFE